MKPLLIALVGSLILGFSSGSPPGQRTMNDENLDSLSKSFRAMTRQFTTPEFERRKKTLRLFQQRGYVEVLSDVVAGDGLSAALSLLKVRAQIEYHLPHDQLRFRLPVNEAPRRPSTDPWHFQSTQSPPYDVPLVQDWTFPEDPWGEQ